MLYCYVMIINTSAQHCTHPVNVSHNFFLTSDGKVMFYALATFLIGEYVHYLYTLCVQLFNDVQLTELNCQHFETLVSPRF